jgi:cereblon
MFCYGTSAGVVLFPEASLHLRVFQPRLVEAIDKAINHVDAPCMIGVVSAISHCCDALLHCRFNWL